MARAGTRSHRRHDRSSTRGQPSWVVVFSEPLDEVHDTVGLIQRQVLIAGLIALVLAVVTGYYAASVLARRVKRLERAVGEVAAGNFSDPIPVDSADELGQLAQKFNEMQRRLARLDSARKEFIANASHELRTPIFSLGGFMELLQDEELDDADARGVPDHDARAGGPPAEAHHRPARPLAARCRLAGAGAGAGPAAHAREPGGG